MENFSHYLGLNVVKKPLSNVGDTWTISSKNVQSMDVGVGEAVKTERDVNPFGDIEYFDHSSTIQANLKSEPEDGEENEDPLCDPEGSEPRSHHQPSHVNDDHSSINVQYPYVSTGEETNERKHGQTETEEKPHKCVVCGITFASNSTLDDHKRMHTKKLYTCEICGISCTSTSGLTLHKRKCVLQTQTNRKPHKCEVCGISFTSYSTLDNHKRLHTGEKPYTCESCGMEFSWILGLDQHKLSHTGGTAYKCVTCKKCFRYQSQLISHNCHIRKRGWKCKTCGVFFTKKVDLLKHEESHMGIKNYKCDECESNFCFPNELSKHKANIHREEKNGVVYVE